MAVQLVYALFLILPGATSQGAPPWRANDDALPWRANDEECDAQADIVSLFQHSLAIMPADRSVTDIGGQQLHDELHLAKQARRDALASLQQLDERIDGLEVRLSASKHVEGLVLGQTSNASLQTPPRLTEPTLYTNSVTNAQMGILCLVALLIVFYIARTIATYEASRDEKGMDPPWHLDCKCRSKALGAGGFLWLVAGMIVFTEFMWFTDDHRHLTVIESIYLTAQIVTTTGYGDLNPSTGGGQVFVAFYALTGVAMIGTLVQNLILFGSVGAELDFDRLLRAGPEEERASEFRQPMGRLLGKYHETFMQVMPVFACVAFGTAFFSLYPGENKTVSEAFYMSAITLLTIGFGIYHPVTQVGKLVGAIWMLIGVVFVGSGIVSATEYMMKQQRGKISKARAWNMFKQIDEDGSGSIDRMEFLHFELLRQGVPSGSKEILEKFSELDTDGNGSLDFAELEAYICTL